MVFLDIKKFVIKASYTGFRKNGINNLPKKNVPIKAFCSIILILGNFFLIKIKIILHRHFIE